MSDTSIMILPSKFIKIDQATKKGKITLQNNVLSGGAYKIRTTSPKDYSVRPNIGIIKPLQTVEINVMLNTDTILKQHKFMVEVYEFDYKKTLDEFKKVLKEENLKPACTKILYVEGKSSAKESETSQSNEFMYQCGCLVVLGYLFFGVVRNLVML